MFRKGMFRILVLAGLTMVVLSATAAWADVRGTLSYSSGFTNPFPLPIPAGTSISVGISYTISGSATITDPEGAAVTTIGMSGGSVSLGKAGTYNVSESYHIELTGTPPVGEPETLTDDASSSWSFSNSVPGSTGTFSVSSGLSVSSESEGKVSVSASASGGSATLTGDLLPGESVSVTIIGDWTVDTSISIESPTGFGTIQVSTNLEEATFTLSGGYSGSGKSWTATNVPVGIYSITYGSVSGYRTPSSQTQALAPDGTISFSGTYNPILPPEIYSVEVLGSPARMAGDVITVILIGESNGTASLSIAGVTQDIPMPESENSSGTYVGQYTALEGKNVRDAKVTVILTNTDGLTSVDESKTASVITAPWDVNSDGVVDMLDIEAVGANLGKDPIPELDVNSDGAISLFDIILVSVHFGEVYGQ